MLEPIPHRRGEPEVTPKLGGLGPPSAQIRSRLGLTGAARAVGAAAPRQLPAHRRAVTAHQHSDPGDTRPSRPVRLDPSPLIRRHPACHTGTSTGGCGYRHPLIMTRPSQPPVEFADPLQIRLHAPSETAALKTNATVAADCLGLATWPSQTMNPASPMWVLSRTNTGPAPRLGRSGADRTRIRFPVTSRIYGRWHAK